MTQKISALCAGMALCLALAGCAPSPAPAVTPTPTQMPVETHSPDPEYSAGPDGKVDPTPPITSKSGRSNHSALEKAGKGIEDSIHSVERNVNRAMD
ncbi:MAG: hypothetical protein RSG86_05050 [Oscillospiraceae bacterium]